MPHEIVIKRRTIIGALSALGVLATLVIAIQIPEIRREIKIWRM